MNPAIGKLVAGPLRSARAMQHLDLVDADCVSSLEHFPLMQHQPASPPATHCDGIL
jgi:hypothetical protein